MSVPSLKSIAIANIGFIPNEVEVELLNIVKSGNNYHKLFSNNFLFLLNGVSNAKTLTGVKRLIPALLNCLFNYTLALKADPQQNSRKSKFARDGVLRSITNRINNRKELFGSPVRTQGYVIVRPNGRYGLFYTLLPQSANTSNPVYIGLTNIFPDVFYREGLQRSSEIQTEESFILRFP